MKESMPSLSAIHPLEFMKKEWMLSRKFIHSGGLIVEHDIQPPNEIETPPATHHIICLLLSNYSPRQVTRFDGREYDGMLHKGDFWLLPAGMPAQWYWEGMDECLLLMIDPVLLHQIATETNCINPAKIELSTILLSRDPQLESIALSFKKEMTQDNIGGRLYIESLANILVVHLLRNYCTFNPVFREYEDGLPKDKLKQAIDYINAHLDDEIKLADISELVGMSQYYFCRLFKQSMGVAPYQYVIQQRLEKARDLLRQKKIAIADIALQCGFANQSHFTKHFRKLTGTTPKAYRGL